MVTHKAVNVWPYVQFDPVPHANFNHPDQGQKDDFQIDALLKEFRETRGLHKTLNAIQRTLTVIQGDLQ